MIVGKLNSTKPKHPNQGEWHLWFAWHPVVLKDGRWAWLSRVKRKRIVGETEYEPDRFVYVYIAVAGI